MSKELEILEDISKEECLFKRSCTVYMGGEKVDSFTWKHTIGDHFRGGIYYIKQALLKLDFLEDAMDLPTNCFSSFKNRNGDEVTIMRKERYEEYCIKEKVLKIIKEKNIDIIMIRMSETLDKYNLMIYKENFNRKELTQEEFDLLKWYFK